MKPLHATLLATLLAPSLASSAAVYSDRAAFMAELTGGSTMIDTSAYAGMYTLSGINASGDFTDSAFFGPNAYVEPRRGLIYNGSGVHGISMPHVGLNFADGINAVGVGSNAVDGGRIQLFDGIDGSGTLLGEFGFGGAGEFAFTGVVFESDIRSAVFTCDFNGDFFCGLYDPVYGTSPVPLPAAAWLFASALGLFSWNSGRRRKG